MITESGKIRLYKGTMDEEQKDKYIHRLLNYRSDKYNGFTPEDDVDHQLVRSVINDELNRKKSNFFRPKAPLNDEKKKEDKTDSELLTSLTHKCNELEDITKQLMNENAELRKKLKNQESYDTLEWKMKYYESQQRLREMEKFFADYDLVFVGNEKEGNGTLALVNEKEDDGKSDSSLMTDLVESLKLLNGHLEDEEKEITIISDPSINMKTFGNRSFSKIPIEVFNNGIYLMNGPFRDLANDQTQQFIVDVIDGYYPSELKIKYPDGVFFDVKDSSEVKYSSFVGTGRRLKSARSGLPMDIDLTKMASHKIGANGNIIELREDPNNKVERLGEDKKTKECCEIKCRCPKENYREQLIIHIII
ncbi:hypothetical protein SNEBB_011025 [Seison nebaliae]|nr:hypothetical protein SNEBB_011025 [Seison nebaliae]